MTKIQIIKKQNGYAYKYNMTDKNNKVFYVTKSGFKTPEEALETAKKSYNHRINSINPTHITKPKRKKKKEKKPITIKNLKITDGGCRLVTAAVYGTVFITGVFAGIKVIHEIKGKFPPKPEITQEEDEQIKKIITKSDCDFSNLHIILRTTEQETIGVGATTSSMLTKLGISNEIVSKDNDLSNKVSNAINNNPDSNIVVINIESGLENTKSNNAIIMGDCSNRREYPSDVLAACIKESLYEYNLAPVLRSGTKAGIWRTQTYIEKELTNSNLINNVSQLTIDLPLIVGEDEITRNDAAASIVEGIMRWTSLDVTERYKDIYYTVEYGDTVVTIMEDHGISIEYMEEYSDIDMHKGARVGNRVSVAPLPEVSTSNVIVHNPCTTTDPSMVHEEVITYTVESGDTVTKIANMYGVKIDDIVVPSGNINNIHIGDKIYITTCDIYETHAKTGENIDNNKKI